MICPLKNGDFPVRKLFQYQGVRSSSAGSIIFSQTCHGWIPRIPDPWCFFCCADSGRGKQQGWFPWSSEYTWIYSHSTWLIPSINGLYVTNYMAIAITTYEVGWSFPWAVLGGYHWMVQNRLSSVKPPGYYLRDIFPWHRTHRNRWCSQSKPIYGQVKQ